MIISGSVGALLLVVAALAGVTVLNNVNQRAEEEVRRQVDAAIAESPMRDSISFGEINVRAAHGQIEIADVVFENGDTSFRTDALTLLLPRNEALALSRNAKEAMLTDVTVILAGIVFRNPHRNTTFTLEELTVQMQGQVPTALFGDNPQEVLDNPENGIRLVGADGFCGNRLSWSFP